MFEFVAREESPAAHPHRAARARPPVKAVFCALGEPRVPGLNTAGDFCIFTSKGVRLTLSAAVRKLLQMRV